MSKKGVRKISVGRSTAPVTVQLEREGRLYWGHKNVLSLVTKVGEHWEEFCNGIRKKKYIWKDIAEELSHEGFPATSDDCDRKWRNLKIRYMAVYEKQLSGDKGGHRIDYFDQIHAFLQDDPDTLLSLENRRTKQEAKDISRTDTEEDLSDVNTEGSVEWTDKSVQQLLDLLLEFREWFTENEADHDDDTIWEIISEQMKLEGHQPGPEQCRQKWISLAQGFQHHKSEAEATGTVVLWPYYTRVRHVMNTIGFPTQDVAATNTLKRRKNGTHSSPQKVKKYIKKEVEEVEEGLLDEADDQPTEMTEPSTSSRDLGRSVKSKVTPNRTFLPGELREVCQKLEHVEENIGLCHRLDRLEARLDDAAQQHAAHRETNTLLTKILSELSRLSRALTTHSQQQGSSRETTDINSGITIVVPHSQNL